MEHSKTVKRIAALFICCVIMVGVFLPFFVYSANVHLSGTSFYTYDIAKFNGSTFIGWVGVGISGGSNISLDIGYTYRVKISDSSSPAKQFRAVINGVEISTNSNNPSSINYSSFTINYSSNYYSSQQLCYFYLAPSGYTLTFDSQGGSSIAAESGVTDVILGDSTGYFPQYIPTRSGYEFLGWSLTPGGTYVRQVSLTEDTTIYANWRVNDGWCQVSFPDNDVVQLYLEGMIALPSNIAVQNNHNFSVYYYNPSSIPDYGIFFDEWIVTEQLTDVTVTETLRGTLYDETNDIYKLDLSVTGNDITVVPKIYYPHICKLRWDSSLDNYITVSDGSNTYSNGDIIDYYSYHGLDLTFNVEFPYMYCRMILYEEGSVPVVLPDEYLTYYGYADDDSNSVYNYHVHIDSPVDCVLLLNADAIDIDYDPNDPVVSFDESGNAHWVVSAEDSFMDVDWDTVYSIIPSDFNGIMGTVFNLKGLAIIGSICFVAAFAIWFVRRGG